MTFQPLFRNPHAQTIGGSLWPRHLDTTRFPVHETYYRTEPDVQVLVCEQRPSGTPRGELILVHGLEGSSEAGYMISTAQTALEAGFTVHRTNIRGCGGTESLCRTLYHAGLTSDLRFLLRELRARSDVPRFLAGYSLGANQVLKLLGELGEEARGLLSGAIAVSTPIDLDACARALSEPPNFIYEWRFLKAMDERLRFRNHLWPGVFRIDGLDGITSVYQFDDRITAPFFGFGRAANYYATQSSRNFLENIRVPVLMIQAKDDPLIPFRAFRHPAFDLNPYLTLMAVDHGGHVGFLAKGTPRWWLDHAMTRWMLDRIGA